MRHTALWFLKSQINDFSDICRRRIVKLFYKRGPATAKLLSPSLLWVRGTGGGQLGAQKFWRHFFSNRHLTRYSIGQYSCKSPEYQCNITKIVIRSCVTLTAIKVNRYRLTGKYHHLISSVSGSSYWEVCPQLFSLSSGNIVIRFEFFVSSFLVEF